MCAQRSGPFIETQTQRKKKENERGGGRVAELRMPSVHAPSGPPEEGYVLGKPQRLMNDVQRA